ncbi:hypothetical protein HBA53_25415 (plasmid) [Rhodococcus pyridinivorans]|uniref:hypothetical protein n=1 Tax=Rhodococcus pyridinivorans TaxID=103816 RepID=UPI001C30D0BF|nr:hypothetical protein [Rhodococcus pyridinivorans]QXF84433.1 hypothetical protein HBA53_25415 [Rhodococcus pyridinivorans]
MFAHTFDSNAIVSGRQVDGGTRQRTSGSIDLPYRFRRKISDIGCIATCGFFAECTQPNRAAAEAFAFDKLFSLGKDQKEASEALKLARIYSCRCPHLRRPHLPPRT